MTNKTDQLTKKMVDYIKSSVPAKCSNGMSINIDNVSVTIPKENFDIEHQLQMKYSKKGNTEGYVGARVTILNPSGAKVHQTSFKKLVTFPVMTDRGSFIVNGVEKNILSQMRLKPGCYVTKNDDNNTVKTNITFARNKQSGVYAPRLVMVYNAVDNSFKVTVNGFKKLNINIVNFMNMLGYSDADIKSALGNNPIADAIVSRHSKQRNEKNISELFKLIFPKGVEGYTTSMLTEAKMRELIWDFFAKYCTFGTGAKTTQSLLDVTQAKCLTKEILLKAIKKTMGVVSGLIPEDKKDEIKYKDVYSDVDLIFEAFANDFDKFLNTTKERVERDKSGNYERVFLGGGDIGESYKKLIGSNITQSSEETNPLFMESMNRKITQLGPDGISRDSTRNETRARNLTFSGYAKIDPIETPESANIGIDQHLTDGVIVKNNTIFGQFYKVTNGEFDLTKKVELDPADEEKYVIGYKDSRYLKKEGNKMKYIQDTAPGRQNGKKDMFPVSKIKYVDASSVLGTAANLTPFVAHNDGARALMGAAMQKQSIDIVNKEPALVTTLADEATGETYDEKMGKDYCKPVMSNEGGTITDITPSKIIVTDNKGNKHEHQYYNFYKLNQSFINNELKVKVGDKVKKGDMLAEGWHSKDGKLSLGANARIGYLPFNGSNYEDGIVISKSFANKMTSVESEDIEFEVPKDALGGRGSGVKSELKKYSVSSAISKFDNDGMLKVGDYAKPGSAVMAILRKVERKDESSMDTLDLLSLGNDKETYRYSEFQIPQGSYSEGKIVRITVVPKPDSQHKQKIVFTIVTNKPLKPGDKIAGRHGNKGTITKVLDDEEMPVSEDGKKLDLMFSPLAVPSRKNTGQIFETNAGLIAEKTGERFVVNNFDHTQKDKVMQKLKEIGFPDGKMKVTLKERDENGKIVDVPVENPVTVGNMYIIRLKHKVDDKIQGRSNLETYISKKDHMPAKVTGSAHGEKSNPQRFGEMEMRALQGHGAIWNMIEDQTIKADGGGDRDSRVAIYRALATGNLDSADLKKAATPQTLKIYADTLKGLGMDVKPTMNGKEVSFDKPFDSIGIAPLDSEKFLQSVGENKEVTEVGAINARKLYGDPGKNKTSDSSPFTKGGLLDPDIFGNEDDDEAQRNNWGYVKLAVPVPNPMLLSTSAINPYTVLTGKKKEQLEQIADGKKAVVSSVDSLVNSMTNLPDTLKETYKQRFQQNLEELGLKEGDLVDVKKVDELIKQGKRIPFKIGGEAITNMLKQVDVDKTLEETKTKLDASTKPKEMNELYKKVRVLQMVKNNNIKPENLMMKYLPITPAYMRPIMADTKNRTVMVNDLNKLYERTISANNIAKKKSVLKEDGTLDFDKSGLSAQDMADRNNSIYNSIKMIQGKKDAYDYVTKKKLKPIGAESLGSKHGLIRGKMLAKRLDFSGRSVIGVDPTLGLDEASVPYDMAKQLYRPFIVKELISRGLCEPNEEAAKKRIEKGGPEVKKVVQEIANNRPLLLNRAPSLHKLSVQALKPIIKDTEDGTVVKRNIELNPLVVTAFNADFDGDQMAAHVPVTDKANEEAKKLMMPSSNLINPTDGKMVFEIRHEMALGIYQITIKADKIEGKPIPYNNYKQLERDYYMGKIGSRQAVKTPIWPQPITAGMALFNWLIPDKYSDLRNFKKAWGKKQVSQMITEIYKRAEANDFKDMSKVDIANLLGRIKDLGFKASTRNGVSIGPKDFVTTKEIANEIKTLGKKDPSPQQWKDLEDKIESSIEKGLLPVDNPLQIMMNSGARANAQQIRKMMATVGVGMNVDKKLVGPIQNSHFDGLSPQDYYTLGMDSRKGIYDRSVATAKPGEVTRNVWSTSQDVVVTEADCKTNEFIMLKKNNSSVKGRYAGKDILNEKGAVICKKGQIITNQIYDKIYKDDSIEYVPVRSPLRCKTPNGVCQKCYGAMPGTMQPVKIGTAVGVLASQALGEPITQMTMNTFHTGGANSAATLGLPRIKSILSLSSDKVNGAVIADNVGEVKSIVETPMGVNVVVGRKTYKIPKKIDGTTPKVRVKVGDMIKQGDFLTVGDNKDIEVHMDDNKTSIVLTNADPRKLYNEKVKSVGQHEALNYSKDYLTNAMEYAIKKSNANMDRRHSEIITSRLTSTGTVTDSGDSNFMKGQQADIRAFERWNEEHCNKRNAKAVPISRVNDIVGRALATTATDKEKGIKIPEGTILDMNTVQLLAKLGATSIKVIPKPIKYSGGPVSNGSAWKMNDNWFGNTGVSNFNEIVSNSASMGMVDKLDNPRSRLMAGKVVNVGEGATLPKEVANGMHTSMLNFFRKDLGQVIDKLKNKKK